MLKILPRLLSGLMLTGFASAAEPIARVLPPPGIELPADTRSGIEQRLRTVLGRVQSHAEHPRFADVAVLVKAVDFALKHGEFYKPQDAAKATRLLELADARLAELSDPKPPSWTRATGRTVRGFQSAVDGSYQPYGLVIPKDVSFDRPVPLYVWLHGRGDQQTDLHFLVERLDKDGQIQPPGAIVLHPFGRQCIGFKSAGETDVLEAIAHVEAHYPIDRDRIVLIGFSMGGAGAWHLGAHYTQKFVAISPGAGFAETARYQNLKPQNFPPKYEQSLWNVYDTPEYVRNLFNRPVIAYSGEIDKQIQAARVMEEAFRDHGRELAHLIGPQTAHKYHPETLKELLERIAELVAEGRPQLPKSVTFQTRTLRYHELDWVKVLALEQHWQDTRVDALLSESRQLQVGTKNVVAFQIHLPLTGAIESATVDGQKLDIPRASEVTFVRDPKWRVASNLDFLAGRKRPGLQGPIDDAFLEPFLVVLPSGKESSPAIQRWLDVEIPHFRERWQAVFRGELRVKRDEEVTEDDLERFHIVAWGTPASNSLLRRAMESEPDRTPVRWSGESVMVGERQFAAAEHVPVFISPNPLFPQRYLVVNSGPTFREAHDRTNSLQNPKLPDWAVLDITAAPTAAAAGKVVAADFFNEHWQIP